MGLLRVIKKEDHNSAKIVQILNLNKQIKFVSLMGVDLGGNATDEKIPVELFKKDIDDFLYRGIQTDGSSVELHEIATLNNAKVDLLPDLDVNWYIDYNTELTDYETNLPVGSTIANLLCPSIALSYTFIPYESGPLNARVSLMSSTIL